MFDTRRLTKEWIQFLKNNQIVSGSDPATGKLHYKKKVTPDMVTQFLETKTDFDEETIAKVIHSVLSNKATSPAPDPTPGPEKKKYNNDDAEDIPFREVPRDAPAVPGKPQQLAAPTPQEPEAPAAKKAPRKLSSTDAAIRKRSARTPGGKAFTQMQQSLAPTAKRRGKLKEDIGEEVGYELDEKDVEAIFGMLASNQPENTPSNKSQERQPAPPSSMLPPDPAHREAKKQENIKKLKRLVRDGMSPFQRQALWRALNESVLTEAQIEPSDVNAVFKDAYKIRDASTKGLGGTIRAGLGKINKGLQKDKLEISDLQQAWKDAGYPDDTRDIEEILKDHGFGPKEIHKIFTQVFGTGTHEDDTVSSPAIIKIADYVKANDFRDEMVAFLQKEFAEELGIEQKTPGIFKRMFGRKATTEDIRQIFTSVLQEERTMRAALIKEQGFRLLGRNRK
jgi:hypothetical protein